MMKAASPIVGRCEAAGEQDAGRPKGPHPSSLPPRPYETNPLPCSFHKITTLEGQTEPSLAYATAARAAKRDHYVVAQGESVHHSNMLEPGLVETPIRNLFKKLPQGWPPRLKVGE